MKYLPFIFTVFAMLLTSCASMEPVVSPSVSSSPSSSSSTETPSPSATPPLTTPSATPLLIEGLVTIKVNVRSGPGSSFDSLGQLDAGEIVRIIARDIPAAWYQILYSSAPQGRGWVAAQFVTVAQGTKIPLEATQTPTGPTGRVIQRLNVRAGPGTAFDPLGVLEPDEVIFLTGRNTAASWFQIKFPAGPNGRGWVTAQYIQTDASAGLPVLDDNGTPLPLDAGGTPSGALVPPTPTLGPATADGDSSTHPAVSVTFTSAGAHRFSYSSQVSSPRGDGEDWIGFIPFSLTGTTARLDLALECTGTGKLLVELWQGGNMLSGWGSLACGERGRTILVPMDQLYLVRLSPAPGEGLHWVEYTLTVVNKP